MTNRLFVAYKPKGISSNSYLRSLKKRYKVSKAGFSGTLDPFASGVLIIAFGQYTKLFRYLKKTPKAYRATLWLGAKSSSLDNENINSIENLKPFHKSVMELIFKDLTGIVEYTPPKFSAKKIDGVRAYKLARQEKKVELKPQVMEVYDLKLLHYTHPFISFEASVSEGAYIRSLGEIIARRLGVAGSLSALTRLSEGRFVYEDEKSLNPINYLDLPKNEYLGDPSNVKFGKVLKSQDFKNQNDGVYVIILEEEFAIIAIKDEQVKYELNKVKLC